MSYPSIIPNSMSVIVRSYTIKSQSAFSGATYVLANPASTLICTLNYDNLTADQSGELTGFLASLRGSYTAFELPLYDRPTPRGVATGSPTLSGSHTAGIESLTTTGWTSGVTGILKAGDYIKVSNQVFIVTADVNSDGSGNATVPVHTALRTTRAGGTSISTTNLTMSVRLSDNDVTWSTALARLRGMSLTFEEVTNG